MSLSQRLIREIKASPAKAGGLGVLLLVAGYFWLPVIMGLFVGVQPTPAAPLTSASPLPASSPLSELAESQPPPAGSTAFDWRKLAEMMEGDPMTKPVDNSESRRDPFAGEEILAAEQEAEATPTLPPVLTKPVTPEEAGLVLKTTMLGSGRRIADIGGRSYTVGDPVPAPDAGSDVVFQVVEIHHRRVVLERGDQQFELRIRRPLVDAAHEALTGRTEPATSNQSQRAAVRGNDTQPAPPQHAPGTRPEALMTN